MRARSNQSAGIDFTTSNGLGRMVGETYRSSGWAPVVMSVQTPRRSRIGMIPSTIHIQPGIVSRIRRSRNELLPATPPLSFTPAVGPAIVPPVLVAGFFSSAMARRHLASGG